MLNMPLHRDTRSELEEEAPLLMQEVCCVTVASDLPVDVHAVSQVLQADAVVLLGGVCGLGFLGALALALRGQML